MDAMALRSPEALHRVATTTRKGRARPSNLREQVDPESCEIYHAASSSPAPVKSSTVGNSRARWPTPTVAEAGKVSNRPNHGQLALSNHPQVHTGATRAAKGAKSRAGEANPGVVREDGYKRKLNPDWVEQLMGLPPQTTQLPTEWIG